MGGRGASFGTEVMSATSNGNDGSIPERIFVAGMNPGEMRNMNEEKTLSYIENKKTDMKKEQLQIIDEYGFVTRAYQGNEHSVSLDMDGIRYSNGKIVTHNHPDKAFGGTFSEADISTLRWGQKEMRASAREGVYSMAALKDARPVEFHNAYLKSAPRLQAKMRAIALDCSKRKYSSKAAFDEANRKLQLEVIHKWYIANASKYGYQYTFTSSEEYKK